MRLSLILQTSTIRTAPQSTPVSTQLPTPNSTPPQCTSVRFPAHECLKDRRPSGPRRFTSTPSKLEQKQMIGEQALSCLIGLVFSESICILIMSFTLALLHSPAETSGNGFAQCGGGSGQGHGWKLESGGSKPACTSDAHL
jgi:hypothetical protein